MTLNNPPTPALQIFVFCDVCSTWGWKTEIPGVIMAMHLPHVETPHTNWGREISTVWKEILVRRIDNGYLGSSSSKTAIVVT